MSLLTTYIQSLPLRKGPTYGERGLPRYVVRLLIFIMWYDWTPQTFWVTNCLHGVGFGPLSKIVAVNEQVTFCTMQKLNWFFSFFLFFLFMRNTAKKTYLAVVDISMLGKQNQQFSFHQKLSCKRYWQTNSYTNLILLFQRGLWL